MTSFQLVEPLRTDAQGGLTDSRAGRASCVRVARHPEPGLLWTGHQHSRWEASHGKTSWLPDIECRIRNYLDLAPDWDSYGGGPPSRDIVDAAVVVAQVMAAFGFSRPEVCPQSSGGIMMEWEGSGITLTVDIEAITEPPLSEWFSFALASPGEPEQEGNFEDFADLLNAGFQPF